MIEGMVGFMKVERYFMNFYYYPFPLRGKTAQACI